MAVPSVAGAIDLGALKDQTGSSWSAALGVAIETIKATKAATGSAPSILWPVGRRVDLRGTFLLPDGFVIDAPGVGNFQRAAKSSTTDVRWSRSTDDPAESLFVIDANRFDIGIFGLSVQANNGGTFFRTRGSVLWTSTFARLGLHGFHHILGTPSEKFLHTACSLEGRWNCNNARGTQFTIGGSDTPGAFTRFLHDVGGSTTYRAEFAASNAWMMVLDSCQKMDIAGLYWTVEGQANGLLVRNRDSDQLVTLSHSTIEGRNGGRPCLRDLVRLRGGTLDISRSRLNYGAKPLNVERGAPVVVERGLLTMDSVWHSRATTDTARRPLVYVANGARFRGRNFSTPDGQPVVIAAEANADVQTDSSATLMRV